MVWKKRYYKKRYYKRKTLKKSNIFSQKGAKAQAKQIYALNKKVNYLSHINKPETQIKEWVMIERRNSDPPTEQEPNPAVINEWHGHYYIYEDGLLGDAGYVMNGNILRPYNINIYGTFVNEMYSLNVTHSQTTNVFNYDVPLTGYLKIIVCKLPGGNQGKELGQITKPFGQNADFGLINGPLIEDVSHSLKIVKTKVVKINNKDPIKNFRITIKNPGAYQQGVSSSTQPPLFKNEYLIYMQYYAPDLLRVVQNGVGKNYGPRHAVHMACKMAFTDI